MESRIEALVEAFRSVHEVYLKALSAAAQEILGVSLPVCLGNCNRVLYPKDQWSQIPKDFREQLNTWMTEMFTHGRCARCYRSAVRRGALETTPREKRILSPEELTYLRKIAGLE